MSQRTPGAHSHHFPPPNIRLAKFLFSCASPTLTPKGFLMKMRAVQVSEKNGPLHLVERDLPEPGRGEVRVRVEACGVCHSDSMAVEGSFPGTAFPRIPGHEIAGRIDALGEGVEG